MKKLFIKIKAKRYDKAIERAESLVDFCSDSELKTLEYVFPELKEELEDEKIRKALIFDYRGDDCLCTKEYRIDFKDIRAWLEKQGEQKPIDKVEPKFKNGQWIVWQDKCYKVNYNGCGYELVDQNGLSTSLEYGTVEECAHIWDITKDAKDGDVLSDGTTIFIFKDLLSDGSVMSYCDYDTDSGESDAFCPLSVNLICSKITPATKEQRDLLFQEMHEAGYEWDSEKRKLKKIEQVSNWSEEDEDRLKSCLNILQPKTFTGKKIENMNTKWLKSLKERLL